ncbi:MAG: hypothetical protein IPM57_10190 [Oligoflexia bacterium]|nr:hypothetical protein [Oligoflexia bacterium]
MPEIVKTYNNPKIFWSEVSPFLKKEEAKNSLFLGLAYMYCSNSTDCLYQSALFDGDAFWGALICGRYFTNQNLIPTPVANYSRLKKLFEHFLNFNIPFNGVIGELETTKLFKPLIEGTGQKTKINMEQGIYNCKKVIHPKEPKDIKFRKAETSDVSTISDWIKSFHNEAVPHDPPVDSVELAKTRITNNMVYVLEMKNKLVSMACWSRDIQSSCSVNLVFTPKELRNNGYASIVTAKLTQHLLDSGKRETNLYTDITNPTSNKIYQNIGYKFVSHSVHLGVF